MNKKKIGFIAVMLCFICVILVIYMNETTTRIISVAGQEIECKIKSRKLTVEDFETVELRISEQDLIKQIGEPDGYLTEELGEINISGVGTMVYVLADGRTVVPFFGFWNPVLFSLVVYEGDRMVYTIKELEEIASDEIRVSGVTFKCSAENRKLAVEDFDDVELWDTYSDVWEKVGEPSFWTGSGLPGYPVYVLEDGRSVIPYFMNGYLYGLAVWKGDSREYILKAIDESEIREVNYNGHEKRYVTRHRNLTVEDFEDIELGVPRSAIVDKIGEPDIRVWDSEIGMNNPAYVLEDDRIAVCFLSKSDEIRYLKKIVIYNGDDIDQVLKESDE